MGSGRSKREASSSKRTRRRSSDSSASEFHSWHRSPRDLEDSDDKKKKKSSSSKVTEEDIAAYLAKKAMKVVKKLKTQMISGYVNDSNPFGDSNLNENFVWGKKIERDVSRGVPPDTISVKAEKKRKRERMTEIEKVKKRKEERMAEIEKAQKLDIEHVQAEFQDWEKREEQFHFEQSKVRLEIRLREGRRKPIDILSKHLDPPSDDSDDIEIVINEPYMVFKGLTVKEMEELREDIKMHLDLDITAATHIQFWEALLVVCDWELAKARKKDAPAELLAEERGLHSSIEADVTNLLRGKNYGQLEALQSQIESQMCSGAAKVVEYWEAILKRLPIYKAKACLKEIHAKLLCKLERLNHDGRDVQNEEAIDPEADRAILDCKHMAMLDEQQSGDNLEMKAMKAIMEVMEEGDVVFGSSDEVNLDAQLYWWHDKYRPRKPKYFNRVHTGYEWNKYNRTHYDHDNPPPKSVQGYKFNIFYPDLVDKIKAPVYAIEKDGDSAETCIIRFHAGPPYEDIAFRIVNKEWEYSHKKGFKCTFERGILRVYFNFIRYRYRR